MSSAARPLRGMFPAAGWAVLVGFAVIAPAQAPPVAAPAPGPSPPAALSEASPASPARLAEPETSPAGPERWEGEMARFRAADARSPSAPGGILFVGSSSIRLWDTVASFPARSIVNRGFGGAILPDVLAHFDTVVTPHRPGRIVFYCGDNDLAKGRTPEQVAADFRNFVGRVHEVAPEARIAYLGIKPSGKRWAIWPTAQRANAAVRAVCAADPRLTYLDTAPSLLGEDGRPIPALFKEDRLHLAPAGYARWNALVEAWLTSTDPLPAATPIP